MVTKNEFVKRVAEATDGTLNQRQVSVAMDAMGIVLTEVVKAQDSVKLCNAVTISGEYREAHTARNPLAGPNATVEVPAKVVPKAKFASNFKAQINE